jgi:hypothetical protein
MKIVDDFMRTERANLNWLEKLFRNYPEFYFTKDIEITHKDYDLKPNVTIRPSVFRRFIAFVFIIMGLIAWLIFLTMVLQNVLFPITLIFLILITVWTGFIIWKFFLNSKYSYKIFIDKNEIRTNKLFLTWDTISEVLVMVKGGGRHMVSTLVIFKNDNTIHRLSLENMGTTNDKLLKYIALYGKKRPHNI